MSDCAEALMLTGALWPCPDCGDERIFVAPDPLDTSARGADLACTDCGAAIFVDPCSASADPLPTRISLAGAA
ncbi:MAG TPA: hypothetical protein VK393_09400 [Nocardioidaceae bacterium]|jgi:predicted RNA-binding Zn-ribbon protein involved in translation (DUF1610 family)|nr:hypothetical protein [Nocardioidaceae bacterium]